MKLEIRDHRPETKPAVVAIHDHVREGIRKDALLKFYGVPGHLQAVLIHDDGARETIQEGRR